MLDWNTIEVNEAEAIATDYRQKIMIQTICDGCDGGVQYAMQEEDDRTCDIARSRPEGKVASMEVILREHKAKDRRDKVCWSANGFFLQGNAIGHQFEGLSW